MNADNTRQGQVERSGPAASSSGTQRPSAGRARSLADTTNRILHSAVKRLAVPATILRFDLAATSRRRAATRNESLRLSRN